jgi:hypothetical protein
MRTRRRSAFAVLSLIDRLKRGHIWVQIAMPPSLILEVPRCRDDTGEPVLKMG